MRHIQMFIQIDSVYYHMNVINIYVVSSQQQCTLNVERIIFTNGCEGAVAKKFKQTFNSGN